MFRGVPLAKMEHWNACGPPAAAIVYNFTKALLPTILLSAAFTTLIK